MSISKVNSCIFPSKDFVLLKYKCFAYLQDPVNCLELKMSAPSNRVNYFDVNILMR